MSNALNGYSLGAPVDRGVSFERAISILQSEWRRFELERADWDVERIRLKAKLNASEKRIAQLSSLYSISQKHIAILESLLREAKKGGGGGSGQQQQQQQAREVEKGVRSTIVSQVFDGLSGADDASTTTVSGLVAATESTRVNSRKLLTRCLGEIDMLLGRGGAHSPAIQPNVGTLSRGEQQQPLTNGATGTDGEGERRLGSIYGAPSSPPAVVAAAAIKQFAPAVQQGDVRTSNSSTAATLPPQTAPATSTDTAAVAAKPAPAMARPQIAANLSDAISSLTVDEMDVGATSRVSELDLRKTFTGHLDTVRSICMRNTVADGPQMLSGSDDGLVILWDIEKSERRKSRRRLANEVLPTNMYHGHLAAVTSVVFAESHEFAYSASLDSCIKVWSLSKGTQGGDSSSTAACFPVCDFEEHTDAVWDLALSVRSSLLVSVSADAVCNVWSTDPKYRSSPLRASLGLGASPPVVPTSVCYAAEDSAQIAIAYSNCAIKIHDTATGNLALSLLETPPSSLRSTDASAAVDGQHRPAASPRITKLVSNPGVEHIVGAAYSNGSVQLFDTRMGRPITTRGIQAYEQGGVATTAIDIDHTSSAIVTGGSDGVVKWWDRRNTSQCVVEVAAHQTKGDEGVCSVGMLSSSNGQQMAVGSAGADGLARLFKCQ
ncbi:WD40 repeat-like protein [Martensiomyces pterosporus]|nr:WD40 repeat-like protein [Martensiomyces pterosporus]